MSSTDELFASLGGSLMKDLWDDLQVGDDDGLGFSLEQLEKELAHLDDTHDYSAASTPNTPSLPFASPTFAPPPGVLSAASLVVSNQTPIVMTTPSSTYNRDAWQASLDKFTATSLELEFLAADSARKSTTTKPSHPPGFLDQAEDYNVKESIPAAPPGIVLPKAMVNNTPQSLPPSPAAAVLPDKNSMIPEIVGPQTPTLERKAPPPPPQQQQEQDQQVSQLPHNSQQQQKSPPVNIPLQPPPPIMQVMPPPHQAMMMQAMLPHPGVMMQSPQGMPPPQGMMMMSPQHHGQYHHHQPPMPMGIPVPQMMKPGVPWKSPVQPPPQQYLSIPLPPIRLYCHPHPAADPIPARSIQSTTMTSRDLAYIVHSLLKPVLVAGSSPTDYDIQYLQRAAQNSTGTSGGKTPIKKYASQKMTKEMESRNQKTMEWVKEKKALGAVAKTDVTRPRALLAVSSSSIKKSSTEDDDDEAQKSYKDRAALWKARLYIDSGQAAVSSLMQIWQTNSASTAPTGVPPAVQFHLKKLFKVLGITTDKNSNDGSSAYQLDETKDSLQVILKLSKGKHFVARVLEHALLPPNAAQVLVPAALKYALTGTSSNANSSSSMAPPVYHDGEEADARLFSSFTRVLTMLPQWSPAALLLCLEAATTKEALSSQPRMECLHTLLRRGNALTEPPEFIEAWKTGEASLMELFG